VVARLANALGYELIKAEANKSAQSSNPDAVDLTMRGWALIWQPPEKERNVAAREFFVRALKLDPRNAEAMVGLCYARLRSSFYGWSTAPENTPAAEMELLTSALAINPSLALGYYLKSLVLLLEKRFSEAMEGRADRIDGRPELCLLVFCYGSGGRAAFLL
jgi:adenylate cyclase